INHMLRHCIFRQLAERDLTPSPFPKLRVSVHCFILDGSLAVAVKGVLLMLVVAVRFQVLTSLRAGRQFFSSPYAHYCYGNAAVWLVFRIYFKKSFTVHHRFLSFLSG